MSPTQARARRGAAAAAAQRASRPAGCCTSARASGIRASRCRAGRSACIWRKDGEPLWRDAALIADTTQAGRRDDRRRAQAFGERSRRACGLPPTLLITAYEDVPKLLATRRRCRSTSIRCRPISRKPDERARLARLLDGGPRRRRRASCCRCARSKTTAAAPSAGMSSPWPLRREQLFAVAGDSPLGLRLPLGSLPDVLPEEEEHEFAGRSVRAARGAAASATTLRTRRGDACAATSRARSIKTALSLRGARRPPAACSCRRSSALEEYVALVAAIEDTAVALDVPVDDRRLRAAARPAHQVLMVTPDPGVIEVNIHPSRDVARADGTRRRRSTRRRGWRASAPRSSCSTAATPAPAAAIT